MWNDLNSNGIETANEPLMPGLTVRLMKDGVAEGSPATTGTNGAYSFTFVRNSAAVYTVQFAKPAGYRFADPRQGTDFAVDSDAEANGVSLPLTFPSARNAFISAALAGEVKADIDIAGKIKVGTTETVFTEANEDTIGGLVLMNSNDNNAKRQQITIQPLTNAAGQVVGGKVEVTWAGGRVDIYDAATGGNKVPTGTVYDNAAGAPPKQLWVQGVEGGPGERGSGTMRDVKIKATPVGNPAGADEVAFTVLWVDVTVVTDPAKTVSAGNDKSKLYKDGTYNGSVAPGNQANSDTLGMHLFGPPLGEMAKLGWGVEGRGVVSPKNFDYPGSDLHLDQDAETAFYLTGAPDDLQKHFVNVPPGNDTALPAFRDDTPDANGVIYFIDSPGIGTALEPVGTIIRVRNNMDAFATININDLFVRASGTYAYYVRFSLRQTNAVELKLLIAPDPAFAAGDNKAYGPDRTSLKADLS